MHPWPLPCIPRIACIAALPRSASAKMMLADLPPSSSPTGLSTSFAVSRMRLAVAPLPVKWILSMSGCATMARATFRTGRHDVEHTGWEARLEEQLTDPDRGVGGEPGGSRMQLPAASAGATVMPTA